MIAEKINDIHSKSRASSITTPFLKDQMLTAKPAFNLDIELAGKPRYYIELSREDIGLVSYFPGLDLMSKPLEDWIDMVLIPAILPVARRKTKLISKVPITFWVNVRGTARRSRGEIFVFITPAYPGINEKTLLNKSLRSLAPGAGWLIPGTGSWSSIQDALAGALKTIPGGNIMAGKEPIPENAYPCCQIFRGKLIEFYLRAKGPEPFLIPVVMWGDGTPVLTFSPFSRIPIRDKELEKERVVVRAKISKIVDGNYCRLYQQALKPIARDDSEQQTG